MIALPNFVPPEGRAFLTVVSLKDGLEKLLKRFQLHLQPDSDDLGSLRYVVVEIADEAVMIENRPRYHPDSIELLFLSGAPDIEARANRVLNALELSDRQCITFYDGYRAYPQASK